MVKILEMNGICKTNWPTFRGIPIVTVDSLDDSGIYWMTSNPLVVAKILDAKEELQESDDERNV